MAGFGERLNKIDRRVEQLEDWKHESDKRFEAFMAKMDMYISRMDQQRAEDRERMDKFEKTVDELKREMHHLTIGGTIGVAAIVVTLNMILKVIKELMSG